MHKLLLLVAFLSIGIGICEAIGAKRCRRAMGRCTFGNGTTINYNTCLMTCCGKALFVRDEAFSECCGDKTFGEMYDPILETCCAWPPAKEYGIHNRTGGDDASQCCGAGIFNNEENHHIQCCSSWSTKPEAFNTLDSMCCMGRVGFITTTAYANCCHDVPYDRRYASCPCGNGKLVKAQRWETECCKFGGEPSNWNPYMKETQACCNGEIYELESQICCNGLIANASTEYCCNGLLTDQTPDQAGNVNIGCCTVGGDDVIYDATTQTCCGGLLVDKSTEGDECCGAEPYFAESGNCCNNTVWDLETEGDACCNGSPYSTTSGVCCGEGVVGVDMVWPACCGGGSSFDAYTETCCGTTVFENPLDARGDTSHHTRCCGDFGDPTTLRPYDYDIETCCNGFNVSLFAEDGRKIDINNMECCGAAALDRATGICCDDVVNVNRFGEFARCFGNITYDIRVEIYCEGERLEHSFGADAICCGPDVFNGEVTICCDDVPQDKDFESTECCGTEAMDSDSFKCCDGEQRDLGGIPKNKAVCCGDSCVDGRDYWCCEGKAYWKGENNENGELLEGLNCDEFFKADVRARGGTRTRTVIGGTIRITGGGGGGPGKPPKGPKATKATTTEATTTAAATKPPKKTRRPRRRG